MPLLVLAAAWAARRVLDVVEVRGRSMAPSLLPGDRLVVVRRFRQLRRDDVVVVRDPRGGSRELVKRIVRVGPAGVDLRGDNAAWSTDARTFGLVPEGEIQWQAVARSWPPERIGRIPRPRASDSEGGEDACAVPGALVAGDG